MNSLAIAAITLIFPFVAALVGMHLRSKLPDHHLESESRDVVKLAIGLVATMTGLVLGLMVASASSTHSQQKSELTNLSANVILLDQALGFYGPEAAAMRRTVEQEVRATHDAIWSQAGVHIENINSSALQKQARTTRADFAGLVPKNESQQMLKSRVFGLSDSIAKSRLMMLEGTGGVEWPFVVILIFWLTALFFGFGLLTRFNATVVSMLFLSVLTVSAAVFMILELSTPYKGFLRISDAPLRSAIAQLGK
jgi:hypothetical protein